MIKIELYTENSVIEITLIIDNEVAGAHVWREIFLSI
jgi:hypothetical protein